MSRLSHHCQASSLPERAGVVMWARSRSGWAVAFVAFSSLEHPVWAVVVRNTAYLLVLAWGLTLVGILSHLVDCAQDCGIIKVPDFSWELLSALYVELELGIVIHSWASEEAAWGDAVLAHEVSWGLFLAQCVSYLHRVWDHALPTLCIWVSIDVGWLVTYCSLVVDPSILLEVLSELMEFLVNDVFLLLWVIFIDIFFFLKWELDVYKLIDIVFVNYLCLQEFNSTNPVMSVVFCLTAKLDVPWGVLKDTLFDVLSDCDFEIVCVWLHECLWTLENVLDLDQT